MNKLLTADEVAELLSVDVSTVHRWARAGDIPAFRLNRVVRFDPDAVEAFAGGQFVGNPAPPVPAVPASPPRSQRLHAAILSRVPGGQE